MKGRREGATSARCAQILLSELQKAEKEGGDDEFTVLRRERKRRMEAATQFRDGGRPELAEQEESEAELISGYLPTELSDEELDRDESARPLSPIPARSAPGTWAG